VELIELLSLNGTNKFTPKKLQNLKEEDQHSDDSENDESDT
jgi:hypothetical protein